MHQARSRTAALARLTAFCLASSALTIFSGIYQPAAAACSTNALAGTTTLSCLLATNTTVTTNTNQNAPATSDRTQSFASNINVVISGTIGGSGLNIVPTGGGHTVAISNSAGVGATAFTINPIATLGVTGDGGQITYSGNGAITNPTNSSVTYGGIIFSNVGSGDIALGSATMPITANISGGQGASVSSAISLTTSNGNQNLFFKGGAITSPSFAVYLVATGTGGVNANFTGNTALSGTSGIYASASSGVISISSDANIGTAKSSVSYGGLVASGSGDVGVKQTGGSIFSGQSGLVAISSGVWNAVSISQAADASIMVPGFAGIGVGIVGSASQGPLTIAAAGATNAGVSGIDANGGGDVSITVTGSVFGGARAIVSQGNATTIVNSGILSGAEGILSFGGVTIVHNSGTITGSGGTAISFNGVSNVLGLSAGSTINGNVVGNGADTLQLEGSTNAVFDASTIGASKQYQGFSTLVKAGNAVWTLQGLSSFNGATTVSSGTLNVTGAIPSSAVSVQKGATLSGTGTVGATAIASGGTLAPGAGGVGTLNVSGNLALNSGAIFAADISPSAADQIVVNGAASIDGAATVTATPGSYVVGQRYTLISATNGLTGTFASLSTQGLSGNVRGRLSYDANDAYLVLDPTALTPQLPSGVPANISAVAGGIDAAVQGGATLGAGFSSLYFLSGTALTGALDQLSGKGAADTGTAVSQGLSAFTLLLQGQGSDRDNADAIKPAQLASGATRIWASAFGGHVKISGDSVSGAAGVSGTNYGFATGVEAAPLDGMVLGGGVGAGRQDFTAGSGTGTSDDVMIGGYLRQQVMRHGYIVGTLGYGWHDIATARTVAVSGADVLGAKFNAQDLGWRIEGGWHVRDDMTPFFALAGDRFTAPAYRESALLGSTAFALSYAASAISQSHTEMGVQWDQDLGILGLSAKLRSGWMHQLDNAPLVTASFQGLPGPSFQVRGVQVATDAGLLGLGLEMKQSQGLDFGLRLDSQLGSGTAIVEGMGNLALHW